jgi:hypothetical protein
MFVAEARAPRQIDSKSASFSVNFLSMMAM